MQEFAAVVYGNDNGNKRSVRIQKTSPKNDESSAKDSVERRNLIGLRSRRKRYLARTLNSSQAAKSCGSKYEL